MLGSLFRKKKFKEPLNTKVYSTVHVTEEKSPIVLVSHELDGDWQFMGNETIGDFREVGRVISLEEVIKLDKSILEVSDLPLGYMATRKSRSEKWEIVKIDYSEDEMKEFGFYCSSCGTYHKEIPMAYNAHAPYQYFQLSVSERELRTELTSDWCVIDNQYFFIKGQIILLVDNEGEFYWNVWVEITEEDFTEINDTWNDQHRFLFPPFKGKIATQLEPYPSTIGLQVKIQNREVGVVPAVLLEKSDHPLFLEQENGINRNRVVEFAKELLYKH